MNKGKIVIGITYDNSTVSELDNPFKNVVDNLESYIGRGLLTEPNHEVLVEDYSIEILSETLQDEYGGLWGEHPDYPRKDWAYEVGNNDTNLGYWDWVSHRLEMVQAQASLSDKK